MKSDCNTARAYTYDTRDPSYNNAYGASIQATIQWCNLCSILYKLNIVTVLY